MTRIALLVCWAALVVGCAYSPRLAPREPWFETDANLERKAHRLEAQTMGIVNRAGMLLYEAHTPLDDFANWARSHDLADAPAWHGHLIAALAFAEAASGVDRDAELRRLAGGLSRFYDVTGVPGLLGRSMLPDYRGPRLDWMDTKADRPTRYWLKGPTGEWWRNGLAKGHLIHACFGLAVPLALERQAALDLEPATRGALLDALLPAAHYLVDCDFHIRDFDGTPTEFGNLGPQWLNGFNMLGALSILASAAPYDARLRAVYEEKFDAWGDRAAESIRLFGRIERATRYHWHNAPTHSNMHVLATATISLLMQETDRERTREIRRAARGLWHFLRFERHAPFTIGYTALVDRLDGELRLDEVVDDLRDFPDDKRDRGESRETSSRIQPLANRPMSTHYWKSKPYYRAIPRTRPPDGRVFGAQDYLLAYWMGRYWGLVPAE